MIKIAILGSENSHAWSFAQALAPKDGNTKYPDFELIGVYGDTSRPDGVTGNKKIEELSACPHFAEHYNDFAGKADAVIVTARHGGNHLKYAREYIKAGIPVWLDKPITCSVEEALETAQLLKENGNIFGGGSSLIYAAEIREIGAFARENAQKVSGGHITAPVNMVNDYGDFWFYSTHLVQMVLSVFGYGIKAVRATKGKDYVDAAYEYDNFTVTARFGTGYTATVYLDNYSAKATNVTVDNSCFVAELEAFLSDIRKNECHVCLKELLTPVFVIDATIKAFNENKRVEISIPEI